MEKRIETIATGTITGTRIRDMRKYRGLKQFSVAAEMQISQQAYCRLETNADNMKVKTLQKICESIKVDVSFLLADDIMVTDQNMAIFDGMSYASICEDYKRLKNKLSVIEDLVLKLPGYAPFAAL
jgi:transcriptional regulator with XRE-family HTH domain